MPALSGTGEATPYGQLQAIIHADFIERYVRQGDRVLDAGCGPGNSLPSPLISAQELPHPRSDSLSLQGRKSPNLSERVDSFRRIADLSQIPDGHFLVVFTRSAVI